MPEESAKQSDGRATQLPVKWIVLGVVFISFMLIFKSELGGLLDRTSDLKITTSGVEIKAEVKTFETPIGRTEVSVVPVLSSPQAVTGVKNTTYVNTEYAFQISWPNNTDWRADEKFGAQMLENMGFPESVAAPIAVFSNNMVDGIAPNINVTVERVGQVSIEDYMAYTESNYASVGIEVVSSSVDTETNGGVIVSMNYMFGAPLYQFQKFAMANGYAYVVTATQVPKGDYLTLGLKQDLASIINSFRVIQ